jgi:hypothetical protein
VDEEPFIVKMVYKTAVPWAGFGQKNSNLQNMDAKRRLFVGETIAANQFGSGTATS